MCFATWLCCSNVLPLRGEQQATDNYPAKAYVYSSIHSLNEEITIIWESILEPMASVAKLESR